VTSLNTFSRATATDSRSAFGHSFGGLVVLETARCQPIFDELFVYEPGVPVAHCGWHHCRSSV
jgi:hypothetical protein